MPSVDNFIAGENLNQAIKCAEKVLGRGQSNSGASKQQSSGQAITSTVNSQESDEDGWLLKVRKLDIVIQSKVSFSGNNLIFYLIYY